MEAISAYADHECGLLEAIGVNLHLLGCRACRTWLRQIRDDEKTFRQTCLQSARGADVTANVMQEVSAMSNQEVIRPAPARKGSRIIELAVVLGILAIAASMLFPVFARSREKARSTSCLSNMKQLAVGASMFAQDHEERLPGAVTWHDDIMPYVNNEQLFTCPTRSEGAKGGYDINPHVAGRKISDIPNPETTILLYEVDASGQPVFPHNGGANYAYVDGHCKWLHKRDHPEDLQSSGFVPPTRNYGLAANLHIAYQATVEVIVDNVYQSVLQAEAAVTKCGGFLMQSSLRCTESHGGASLIVKVPTEQVGNCINALGALGFVASREIMGEDLTRRHVTTTREIAAGTERQERLSDMVDTMDDDRERVAVETNLGEVERQTIAQRDTIFDIDTRVTLATISATLTARTPQRQAASLAGAFDGAASALVTLGVRVGSVAAWVLVFAPVWGALLGIGLFSYRWLRRRGE